MIDFLATEIPIAFELGIATAVLHFLGSSFWLWWGYKSIAGKATWTTALGLVVYASIRALPPTRVLSILIALFIITHHLNRRSEEASHE